MSATLYITDLESDDAGIYEYRDTTNDDGESGTIRLMLYGEVSDSAFIINSTLLWRHYGRDGVSNHQPHDCLLNRLFRRRSKRTSKIRVTGLCAWNSRGTGEFPAQMASNAKNVFIWWRHHDYTFLKTIAVKIDIVILILLYNYSQYDIIIWYTPK